MTLQFDIYWLLQISGLLVWFVILPGLLLQQLFFKNDFSSAVKTGFAFAVGFVLFSIISFIAYFLSLHFNTIFLVCSIVNGFLLAAYIFRMYKRRLSNSIINYAKPDWHLILLMVTLSVSVLFISLFSGWFPRGDAAIHLQVIRNMLSGGIVENAYYSLPGNPLIPDHVYDTYYVLLACISYFSGIELSVVWHYMSPLLSALVPFILYGFLKELTGNRKLIAFSLMCFFIISVFYDRIQYGTVFDSMVYPNRVYFWLMLPVAYAFYFRYIVSGKLLFSVSLALIVAVMMLVHQNGFLFFMMTTTAYMLLSLLFSGRKKKEFIRMVTAAGVVLALSVPVLLMKLIPNLDYIASASSQIWHKHYHFFYLSQDLHAFSLKAYYVKGMILAFLISVFLLFRLKRNNENRTAVLFAAAGLLSTFLVVFNPLVVPWLSKIISYVAIIRMLRIPAYFLFAGLVIGFLYDLILKKFPHINKNRLNIFLMIGAIGMMIFGVFQKTQSGNPHHEQLAVVRLQNVIPENSTVLSDSITSTDMAEFMNINALIIRFNGAADLVDQTLIKKDVNRLLRDTIQFGEAEKIVLKYNINYIVVNPEIWLPPFRFADYPDFFRVVYNKKDFTVYKTTIKQLSQ